MVIVISQAKVGVHPMSHPHAPGKLNPPENPAPKVPYSKSCEEDLRFFKSGYTGYLPRSRDYFAVGLTQMSNSGEGFYKNLFYFRQIIIYFWFYILI